MGHGRIDMRHIDLLPADALTEHMRSAWPTVRSIVAHHASARACQGRKHREKSNGNSLPHPQPEHILLLNRHHWKIEAMHRDKDVTLGEDGYTNRSDNAPRNIFVLTSAARTLLKRISNSPTKAIEMVQDDRNRAVRFISDQKNRRPLKRPVAVAYRVA